jgi:hypothetical protein
MARLVGLEEDTESSSEDSVSLKEPTISEPQEAQTTAPLSSNPFAKVGVVGAATLALVLFAGAFLSQIMSGNHSKPKPVVVPKMPSRPFNEASLQQQQGAEIEALKTKLALAQQANDVKAAQQELRSQKPLSPTIVAKPTPRVQTPTPERTVYVTRTVQVPQRLPVPQNQLPVAPPTLEPSVETTPLPAPPDPMQEWARLAKLGSYGQVSNNGKQSPVTPSVAQVGNPQPLQPAKNDYIARNQQRPTYVPPVTQTIARQTSNKSVKLGSTARGVLVTSVYGESTNNNLNQNRNNQNQGTGNRTNNNIFVVKLTQALKAADGSTALPEGTQIFTKTRSISDKGLVELEVFKVVAQENGKDVEKSISPDALTIRGTRSKPLVADLYKGSGGSHLANDLQLFLLGGAGKVGEVLNQPESKIISLPTTSTSGNVTTTTTSTAIQNDPKRNILAAALDGGGKNAVTEMSRRIQQANSRNLQERTNIWYLPAGKEVEIFVSQEVNL